MLFKSIDGLKLFHSQDERLFFLRKFTEYLKPVLNCFAFGLLENHSHFIAEVKHDEDLRQSILYMPRQLRSQQMQVFVDDFPNNTATGAIIERQVNSFMTSYTNTANKIHTRKGGLFQSPFRRSFITSDLHLQQAIIYVHANAQKHGIVKDFRDYSYTSYNEILFGDSKNVETRFVLDFFGGREKYIQLHEMQAKHFYGNDLQVAHLAGEPPIP
jgi:putative transposase